MADNISTTDKKPSLLKRIGSVFFSPLTSLIIMLAFVSQYFFDWWVIALAAFTGCYLQAKSKSEAFWKGSIGISLLWLVITLYYHLATDGILSTKIAYILPLNGNASILIAITVFIGGLVGGFAGLSGFLVRSSLGTLNK